MQEYGTTEGGSQGAKEALQDHAEKVTEKAKEVGGTVQDRVREQVDTRSTQAGEQVGSVSEAMRNMGEQLRGQGNDLPAQLAHQAADRAEQLGRYLREADADRILRDAEDFGRRQPWVMAAAGLALGVAAARFIKASGRRRYEAGGYGGATPRTPEYGSTAYGSATHGSAAYGTPALGGEDIDAGYGTYPTEPAEITTSVNEREQDTYPLRGRE
jgi:hypothetical protein